MSEVNYKTENEIQQLGIDALCKGIGVVGLIRFMQQFDQGRGDYVQRIQSVSSIAMGIITNDFSRSS